MTVLAEPLVAAPEEKRLPSRTVLLYGLPVLGIGFMWNMVGIYLLKFATDVLLIAPATMGLIFAAGRIWDAVSDPLAGYWSDRTHTRLGRRRPWLYVSALPLGAVFVAIWAPPEALAGPALALWMALCVFAFFTALTAFRVPHVSLGAELTVDYHDRTRVFASSSLFESAGGLIGLAALGAMMESGVPQREFVLWTAIAVSAIGTIGIIVSTALLREHGRNLERGARAPYAAFRDVVRNPHARRLICVQLLQATGLVCAFTSVPYACEYLLGDLSYLPVVMLAFIIPRLLVIPLWAPLSRRFGKRDVWLVANLLMGAALAGIFFLPLAELGPVLVLVAVAGAMDGPNGVLSRSLQADVVDWDEAATGERKEGAYFAVSGLVAKLALGVGVGVVGVVLELAGLQPNAAQGPASLLAIRVLLSFVPLAFLLASALLLRTFALDERAHAALRRDTSS